MHTVKSQRDMPNGPIIMPYQGIWPKIHPTAFIAPGAVVTGDVEIGADSSVFFGCVVRGDVASIRIGQGTNIQDGTVVHVSSNDGPCTIGNHVTIGHQALIHACHLDDHAFVGMRAVVLDHAVIRSHGMLAANAMLTGRKELPSHQLWGGSPAKFMRDLGPDETDRFARIAPHYVDVAADYARSLAKHEP